MLEGVVNSISLFWFGIKFRQLNSAVSIKSTNDSMLRTTQNTYILLYYYCICDMMTLLNDKLSWWDRQSIRVLKFFALRQKQKTITIQKRKTDSFHMSGKWWKLPHIFFALHWVWTCMWFCIITINARPSTHSNLKFALPPYFPIYLCSTQRLRYM